MTAFDPQDDRLSAYLDQALDDSERAAVERLLAESPSARALLDGLRANRAALSSLPTPPTPAGLSHAVRQRLERSALLDDRSRDTSPPVRPLWRGLAYAAILALTVTIGFQTFQSSVRKPPPALETLAMTRKAGRLDARAPASPSLPPGTKLESPPVKPRLKSLGYLADSVTAGTPAPSAAPGAVAGQPPSIKLGAPIQPVEIADGANKPIPDHEGSSKREIVAAIPKQDPTLHYQYAADDSALDNRLTLHVARPESVERVLNEVRAQATQLRLVSADENARGGNMLGKAGYGGSGAPSTANAWEKAFAPVQVTIEAPPEQIGELVSNICRSPVASETQVEFASQGDVCRTWGDSEKLAMNLRRPVKIAEPTTAKTRVDSDRDEARRAQPDRPPPPANGFQRDRKLDDAERTDDKRADHPAEKSAYAAKKSPPPSRGRAGPAAGRTFGGEKSGDKLKDADHPPASRPAAPASKMGESHKLKQPAASAAYRNRNALLIITVQSPPASQPSSRNAP